MRMLLGVVLLAGLLAAGGLSLTAQAADAHAQAGTTATAATGPTWHNGHWWYRHAGSQDWLLWNGSQWTPYVAGSANANRSFSYQPDGTVSGDGFYYPGTQFGTKIFGSYGQRPAASKARANY